MTGPDDDQLRFERAVRAMENALGRVPSRFVCPRCGTPASDPFHVVEQYCATCEDWTGSAGSCMYYDRQGQPLTLRGYTDLWGESFEETRRVAATNIDDDGSVSVSTVWLGVDHSYGIGPPLIFETMVFGGPLNGEQWRYPTEEAALAGHDQAVAACHEAAAGERPSAD